ncbi:hypothetical protein [Dactylosporangium sp. CA-139066]|uniref:hypothetical protein n=1 Tax=Dactylosporangium sp. CA-139066 TaxID=3239930 RepID=UPI003D8D5465
MFGHLVALGLAVAAMFGYGIGSLLQSEGATAGGGVLGIVRRPAYLAGARPDRLAPAPAATPAATVLAGVTP